VKIIHFPHPTLRHKSQPVKRVDKELKKMVAEMFELMFEHNGVGLAANQVDLPLRLFVMNEAGDANEAESLVFINPVISRGSGAAEKEEGCLSLPKVYAPVRRPDKVHVQAYNLKGEEFSAQVSGMFGRIIQHETDHLDGIMFVDRLSDDDRLNVAPQLKEFMDLFMQDRAAGEIPPDDQIAQRLAELESQYC
jgi:peptide deformylase